MLGPVNEWYGYASGDPAEDPVCCQLEAGERRVAKSNVADAHASDEKGESQWIGFRQRRTGDVDWRMVDVIAGLSHWLAPKPTNGGCRPHGHAAARRRRSP